MTIFMFFPSSFRILGRVVYAPKSTAFRLKFLLCNNYPPPINQFIIIAMHSRTWCSVCRMPNMYFHLHFCTCLFRI